MRGPQLKGFAEMAIHRTDAYPEAPTRGSSEAAASASGSVRLLAKASSSSPRELRVASSRSVSDPLHKELYQTKEEEDGEEGGGRRKREASHRHRKPRRSRGVDVGTYQSGNDLTPPTSVEDIDAATRFNNVKDSPPVISRHYKSRSAKKRKDKTGKELEAQGEGLVNRSSLRAAWAGEDRESSANGNSKGTLTIIA